MTFCYRADGALCKRIRLFSMNSHCMGTRYQNTTPGWDWGVYHDVYTMVQVEAKRKRQSCRMLVTGSWNIISLRVQTR